MLAGIIFCHLSGIRDQPNHRMKTCRILLSEVVVRSVVTHMEIFVELCSGCHTSFKFDSGSYLFCVRARHSEIYCIRYNEPCTLAEFNNVFVILLLTRVIDHLSITRVKKGITKTLLNSASCATHKQLSDHSIRHLNISITLAEARINLKYYQWELDVFAFNCQCVNLTKTEELFPLDMPPQIIQAVHIS